MISSDEIRLQSDKNEKSAKKLFEKLGYTADKLDEKSTNREKRPDFLVKDAARPFMLCEVKTIYSAGYNYKNHCSISTKDPKLADSGPFSINLSFEDIDNNLNNAIKKKNDYIKAFPGHANLPLLVIFFFDFWAESLFELYPQNELERYPEISGIAIIEVDRKLKQKAGNIGLNNLESLIKSGSTKGLPPNEKEFRLEKNRKATCKIPRKFQLACLV
ncbi:MAG: hypothetical protein JW803_06370 [Endomicrobiales bacterium]|nr:hypothetical protein [Endomicrobiales bacterium]